MNFKSIHIHCLCSSYAVLSAIARRVGIMGLFLFFACSSSAQNQMFLYDEMTESKAIISTSDGGYIVGGRIGGPTPSTADDATIVKIDPDGNVQWQRLYGGAEGEDITDLVESSTGNYLFTGYTSSFNINGSPADVFAGMVEPDGDLVFAQSVGGNSDDRGNGVAATSDGGMIVTGCLDCFAQSELYLTKISSTGDVEWAYSNYHPGYTAEGYDVIQTSDGGFAVTGRVDQPGNSLLYLMKTDANGNLLWSQSFGGLGDDEGRALVETNSGDLVVIGYSLSFSFTSEDIYLVKTNADGVYQWHQSYGEASDGEFGYGLKELPSGELLLVGATWSYGAGNGDVYLLKTQADGVIIWEKTYGTPDREETGRTVDVRPDGTIVLSGINRAFDPTFTNLTLSNGLVIDADPVGNINDNYIKGNVYHDLNGDCTFQSGEPELSDWIVQLAGAKTWYSTTDSAGNYEFVVPAGSYSLELIKDTYNWQPCLAPIALTTTGSFDTLYFDLPVFNDISGPYLEVDLSAPVVSACSNQNYYINYCNKGSAMANAAQVRVALDPYFSFQGSSIPGSSTDGVHYTFDIGNIDARDCGNFTIEVAVDCNAPVGLTHCMEAHIFPDSIYLPPSSTWDGSSLEVTSYCENDSSVFIIKNVGTNGMTFTQNYIVIEDDLIQFTAPVTLAFGEEEVLRFPANGRTYRVEIPQSPGHPGRSKPSSTEEGCGTNNTGGISLGYVTQFPEDDADFFVSIDCQENTNVIQPFAKRSYPKGTESQHFIDPNEDLEYHIRFRNTFTETIQTVVIRDTLSSFLDVATLRFGASSHPFDYELYGDGIVKFTFHDINLESILNNPEQSIGFIKFRISQLPDLSAGTVITNKSAIYLDDHPPIHSPEIFRTIRDLVVYGADSGSLCYGNEWAGQVITEDTIVYDTMQVAGYDSITITQLSINPVYQMTLDTSICEGEIFYFAGGEYPEEGTFITTLQSTSGCDSTYTINLEVRESPYEEIERTICEGDSLFFGGNIYTAAGKYIIVNTSANGCDSSTHLQLSISESIYLAIDTVMSAGSYYGQVLIEGDTTFVENYTTEMGCDSIVTVAVDATGVGFYDPLDDQLQLHLYPNPTKEDVVIEYKLSQAEEVEIRLYHSLGQRVTTLLPPQRLSAGQHSQRLSLADQSSGTYLLWIRTSRGIQIRKVIKWD